MPAKPTFKTLDPVQTGPFNEYEHRRQKYKQSYGQKVVLAPPSFNAPDHVSPAAVASIHKAFTLSKTSHEDWRSYKREGRFDPRRASGAQRMETDIFKRKTGRSTTKVRVSVLIDASGSMHGIDQARIPNPLTPFSKRRLGVSSATAAAVFGCTIAKALGRIPTVDLDVFQHSAGGNNVLLLKWRWHRGTPLGVFNESVFGIGGGGNADGHAVFAIVEKMRRELKRGERGIVMVVSDGMPSDYSKDGTSHAGQALIDAVAHGRKNGIEVIGVSIDGSDQKVYYGEGYLPFTGNWSSLGTELAKHIGKALARR